MKQQFLSQNLNLNNNFKLNTFGCNSAAGVVVSCKIPILATRVRFPGGAAGDIAQWQSNRLQSDRPLVQIRVSPNPFHYRNKNKQNQTNKNKSVCTLQNTLPVRDTLPGFHHSIHCVVDSKVQANVHNVQVIFIHFNFNMRLDASYPVFSFPYTVSYVMLMFFRCKKKERGLGEWI